MSIQVAFLDFVDVNIILRGDSEVLNLSHDCFSEAKAPPEPVRLTFDLPVDAAKRLSELAADSNDHTLLRELGIVSFQLQGDKVPGHFNVKPPHTEFTEWLQLTQFGY